MEINFSSLLFFESIANTTVFPKPATMFSHVSEMRDENTPERKFCIEAV